MAQLKDTTINGGLTVQSGGAGVELFGSTPYIDFHFDNDSGDYTSRIIESSSGILNVQATDLKLNGDSLGKPNTLYHEGQNLAIAKVVYDTGSDGTKYWYFRPESDIAATSRLGTGTARWNYLYCDYVNASATVIANNILVPNGYAYLTKDSAGTNKAMMFLNTSNNMMFGHPEADKAHSGTVQISAPNSTVWIKNKVGLLRWYGASNSTEGYTGIFNPGTDNVAWLGSGNYRWKKIFAGTSTIATSDEREKSEITSIADYPVTFSRNGSGNIFEQLHDKLNPTTYYLNGDANSGLHIGFIAQDIVKAAEELGIAEEDLAFVDHQYWEDEETGEEKDRYGLAYEELIALNTYVIQKQKEKINTLEERIANLEELVVNK